MSILLSSVNRRLGIVVSANYPHVVETGAKPRANKAARKPAGFSALEGDKLTAVRLKNWAKLSRAEQVEYLKAHPKSIFHKAPLHKEAAPADEKPTSPETPPSGGAGDAAVEPPPSADAAPGAGEPPPSPAPESTPELKMDSETGIPHRAPDQQDKDGIAQALSDLSQPGALDPGSEHREQAASIVEEGAEKLIRENVTPETVAEISQAMANPSQIQVEDAVPAPAAPDPNTVVDNRVQPDDDDEFGDRNERRYRRGGGSGLGKKVAILAGCIALGALLTAGAFAFDPTFALVVGKKITEHFRESYEFAQEVFSSFEGQPTDEGISKFVAAIADFVRKGELDPTWLETARSMTA